MDLGHFAGNIIMVILGTKARRAMTSRYGCTTAKLSMYPKYAARRANDSRSK